MVGQIIQPVRMDAQTTENTKRIAKNTLMLYVRMLFGMLVSLYTSRVVLNTLGVEDYGIYNVVGGFVAMFSLLSGSLSSSTSRFLTFELGKGDMERLKETFSTSLLIHLVLAGVVFVSAESIGVWFLNTQMTIPAERLYAANWVFQASIVSFMFGLFSVPYNASIVSHERMSAFAYIGILDILLRLAIVLFIANVPFQFDKLIVYSLLLVALGLFMQGIYLWYCRKHFEECRLRLRFNKVCWKEMSTFAGWNFLGSTAYLFNTQGVNLLINIFFGVTLNAVRGIAGQVESAISQFVNNFLTAINPQITKSYAAGQYDYLFKLICQGAKYSCFLLLIPAVPIMVEAETILKIWLGIVPDYTVIFLRLSLIGYLVTMIGNTGFTAILATGKIRNYQLSVTLIGCLVFPLTWVCFQLNCQVTSTYFIYIMVYTSLIFVRLYYLKKLMEFPLMMFVKRVLVKVILVGCLILVISVLFTHTMSVSFVRLILNCFFSISISFLLIYTLGLDKKERLFVRLKVDSLKNKIIRCL